MKEMKKWKKGCRCQSVTASSIGQAQSIGWLKLESAATAAAAAARRLVLGLWYPPSRSSSSTRLLVLLNENNNNKIFFFFFYKYVILCVVVGSRGGGGEVVHSGEQVRFEMCVCVCASRMLSAVMEYLHFLLLCLS